MKARVTLPEHPRAEAVPPGTPQSDRRSVCGGCHDAVAVSITRKFTINSALDLSLKLVLFFLSSNAFSMHAYSSYVGQAGGEVCCFKLVCSFLG